MPLEPSDGDEEKKQISAVVWVFLAVGAILIGTIVVLVMWKNAKRGDPLAIASAMEVIKGVTGVVGAAAEKVEAS